MKTKKLFLIITLVVGCAVGAHAQKTVFKFRDAQARAGDAVTEVCVKPTVVEVKILEDKGRIKDEWTLSKEEVEIAMKGELDNIRAWGTYLSTIKYNCDVIMAAGAFVQGSSIELSADGPLRAPYSVYFQGGLTWYHAKVGILKSLQRMYEQGLVELKEV